MRDLRRKSDNVNIAEEMLEGGYSYAKDRNVLAELIDNDIRENLPPQMMAVVAAVFRVIEKIDGGGYE